MTTFNQQQNNRKNLSLDKYLQEIGEVSLLSPVDIVPAESRSTTRNLLRNWQKQISGLLLAQQNGIKIKC